MCAWARCSGAPSIKPFERSRPWLRRTRALVSGAPRAALGLFQGRLRFFEFFQLQFQFGGVDFGAFVEAGVLDGYGCGERERLGEAQMFAGESCGLAAAERKQTDDMIGRDEGNAEPGSNVCERWGLAPLRFAERVFEVNTLSGYEYILKKLIVTSVQR